MLINAMPRYEPLSEEALELIHSGWERLGREVGVQFDNPEALRLFAEAGQTVDGETVRFDPGFLRAQATLAPPTFRMRARNPERDLEIGGDRMVFCAVQGPPFVRQGAERRDGTYADFMDLLRLVQMDPNLDTPGRNVVEPNDIALDARHLMRALAMIRLTDRVWAGEPSSGEAAADCLRMAEIVHGELGPDPVLFANCNVNSPLRFDARMLDGILNYGAAGQAIIITPFLLMGAMAPVSTPAALVQQTLEALAGIALVQLIRPGTPCVMGSFLSSTDMKTGSPAFGGPESAFGLYASGQIARDLQLPWRSGGGTLTSSPLPDYQAGYEAMNTLLAAFLAGANVCWQSAGWMEGGLVTCFEKFMADTEVLDLLCRQFRAVELMEADLAFDAHVEVGHGGHFFGAQHTLERFRDCFWRPTIATTDNHDRWTKGGSLDHAARAANRWREQLEAYEQPPLDAAVEAELVEFVAQRAAENGDEVPL